MCFVIFFSGQSATWVTFQSRITDKSEMLQIHLAKLLYKVFLTTAKCF